MKILAVYVAIGCIIFSCNSSNNSNAFLETLETKSKPYEQIWKEELNTGKRNDTIFLGFVFGMNKKEVDHKFNELSNSGKVTPYNKNNSHENSMNYSKGYLYNFYTDNSVYESTIYYGLYNDSLYFMKIYLSKDIDGGTYDEVVDMYIKRYKTPIKDTIDYFVKNVKIWINGNREIRIGQSEIDNSITIEYIDLKARQSKHSEWIKKLENQEKQLIEKSKKTLDEL